METAGHAEQSGGGGLPQFDPTWFASQAFWLLVFFAFLYVFFARKTLPEIGGVIGDRQAKIKSDLDQAEQLSKSAESIRQTYETGLDQARAKAAKAVAEVETSMSKKLASQSEQFRVRAEKQTRDAEAIISAAKQKALGDMSGIAAEVASEAVKKIIGVGTDVNQAKAIVQSLSDKAKAA
jgi:F-type H+-transporting ATPase subunit b